MMPKVEWTGDRLVLAAQEAVIEIAQMTAEIVKGKAVNLCPYDSSHTRESATVTDLEKASEISFNTPQAAWLHESQNYKPSHAGTGPGYLRQPLLESEEQYQKDIAAALQAIFS